MVFWTVYVTGRLATTERLAPSETVDGIEVPVIGTVGDFPEPEHRIVVNLTADGRIVVDGVALTFTSFGAELKRRAAGSLGARKVGPEARLSDESVVLRVDGDVSWRVASALIEVCAAAMVDRGFFAVRHEGDSVEGAVAAFLPSDGGGEDFGDPSLDQRTVFVGTGSESATPAALREYLAALPESRTSKLIANLDVDPTLPTRTALTM